MDAQARVFRGDEGKARIIGLIQLRVALVLIICALVACWETTTKNIENIDQHCCI